MEARITQERKALTVTRVTIALLFGLVLSQTSCLCAYESIYIESVLAALGIVIFPYLTYLVNKPYLSIKFRWLFIVYGAVTLFAIDQVYSNALHRGSIPDFLMTSEPLDQPTELTVVDLRTDYQKPESLDEDFLAGHKYAWELTHWRFPLLEKGWVWTVPEESVQDAMDEYQTKEELNKKSPAYRLGMKEGTKAAINVIQSTYKTIKKEGRQEDLPYFSY